jgi:hypothetical protein
VRSEDQRLVRPGEDLDRLGLHAVAGDRAQLMAVGANHVRQDVRIAGVALGTGHAATFAVTSRLQRVDRVDLVASGEQRLHPRAAVGLDAEHHGRVVILANVLADHRMQPCDPRDTLG